MSERQPQRLFKRVAAVLLVLGVAAAIVVFFANTPADAPYENPEPPPPPPPEPVSVESRILFGGDTYWGRLFEREQPGDYAFPFSGLSTLNKANYDAWIVNVECPVTDEVVSFEDQWNAVQFNCRPEYLEEAAKWFEVVSLANNHTGDVRGQEGLAETRANIEAAGIQHFGNYEPGILEDLCEVVTIDATLRLDDDSEQAVQLPIAMCGYHGVFRTFTEEEIAHLSTVADHFITVSMPHAGAEYLPNSDSFRETAYRAMVDAGADVVLGNHPHWVQNTEVYNDSLIVYSLGNFIFDQQFSDEVTRSAMIDMSIVLEYDENVQAYLDIAESCTSFQDDCVAQFVAAGATKPEAILDYDVIATRTTDLVTQNDPAGLDAILERMNWNETLDQL